MHRQAVAACVIAPLKIQLSSRLTICQSPRTGEAFQAAATAATDFENSAAAAGWVPGAPPGGGGEAVAGRLHSYIKHALNRYLHAKRLRCGFYASPCCCQPIAGQLISQVNEGSACCH